MANWSTTRVAGAILATGLAAAALTGCDGSHARGSASDSSAPETPAASASPTPQPGDLEAVMGQGPASGDSKDITIRMSGGDFRVTHDEQGGACGIVGCGGSFSATVIVDTSATARRDSDGNHFLDVALDKIHCADVQSSDPSGLDLVSWEIDKQPLPDYPSQAVDSAVAVFADGQQVTGTQSGSGMEFVIPATATRLVSVQLHFSFNWSENDTTVDLQPEA